MIHPKLMPYQELALRRVNVQQQSFASQYVGTDKIGGGGATAITPSGSSAGMSRTTSARSEVALSPGTVFPGPSATPASSAIQKSRPHARDALLTGCGTNSTAPASIARPGIKRRDEWSTALHDIEPFVLPQQLLCGSPPNRQKHVRVHYIADQYDRQWLTQLPVATTTTKGKTGSIESSVTPQATRHKISLTLFEDLITAFELGSYMNAEVPIHRQPVSTFEGVTATGADATVVEEVRRYWLSKRQALGGNVPCIPALRMDVREDNQNSLCHSDILQYCPLPFSYRDCPVPLVKRLLPRCAAREENTGGENGGQKEVVGRKRERRSCESGIKIEDHNNETVVEVGELERQMLATAGLKVAQAVLEREEWKLAHTHIVLYELSLLRRLSVLDGDVNPSVGFPSSSSHAGGGHASTLWASDEDLQGEWVGENELGGEPYDSVTGRGAAAALESVMAIERRHC
ncbi:hypothetical protein, conserved [Trypanosoma brucei gambiense DAL972]|uniref:Uncharacterized protein n=2 Tax=Trypanosoma brucei TaxID=5691 RepID=C9ZZZ7_TRYB9|nr:hypothetical protein, conserved [Trypanosoma brucei gambiense DAL972]CBH16555.1 hypothetical protein, conserved [Trypanosoma brucei gambiense DAL972]|eukprot:XP_011778819.1 hypothetical protein, conserved [Trypanosoma brucei gambiense DAL972]